VKSRGGEEWEAKEGRINRSGAREGRNRGKLKNKEEESVNSRGGEE
jgi:hypothetical protein